MSDRIIRHTTSQQVASGGLRRASTSADRSHRCGQGSIQTLSETTRRENAFATTLVVVVVVVIEIDNDNDNDLVLNLFLARDTLTLSVSTRTSLTLGSG